MINTHQGHDAYRTASLHIKPEKHCLQEWGRDERCTLHVCPSSNLVHEPFLTT